jgi:Type 9 secretion system plug protein 1st domain
MNTVHKITKNILPLLLTLMLSSEISASIFIYKDSIFKENIKTVQLYREGWKLTYPIVELNESLSLILSFDDLSSEVKNYHYKIYHCNSKWEASEISEFDFLDGYTQNQISDYSFSFNTYVDYIHYTLKLPNDDFKFKISGNYIIMVFEDFDESNVVLTRRFMITENLSKIDAEVKRPILSMYRDCCQEILFTVNPGSISVEDPYSDIKTIILQNGRWDNFNDHMKPVFNRNGILEYGDQINNIFSAGNEFRWFDTKSTRYQSPYIKNINFRDNRFYVDLFPEELKSDRLYFYDQDLNGKYYIEVQEQENDDTDADYLQIDFKFPFEHELFGGDLYITGSFSNWEHSEKYKMKYDAESKSYKNSILLKQGYYNYQYVFIEDHSESIDFNTTEGNHYETENDYIILVYYQGSNSRYERIIGYQIINSLHKN